MASSDHFSLSSVAPAILTTHLLDQGWLSESALERLLSLSGDHLHLGDVLTPLLTEQELTSLIEQIKAVSSETASHRQSAHETGRLDYLFPSNYDTLMPYRADTGESGNVPLFSNTKTEITLSEETSTLTPLEDPPHLFADRYQVVELLGQGGMSKVWRVKDLKIGREVALKQQLNLDGETARRYFNQEASVMSALDHPGILPLYDLIKLDQQPNSPNIGYTMRIASYESLHEHYNRINLDLHKLCQTIQHVALTLEFAHQKGVLHRDVKPQNILLGEHGEVYLTDWGICQLLPNHPDYHTLTDEQNKALVGSPPYMAPEQILRDNHLLSPRTDVYGLGATLYFMLTGTPPCFGRTLQEIFQHILKGDIKPPDEVWTERGIDRRLPKALSDICMKALSLVPADRFQSGRALAAELERFIKGELDREQQERVAQDLLSQGKSERDVLIDLFEQRRQLHDELKVTRLDYEKDRSLDLRDQLWRQEQTLEQIILPLETAFSRVVSTLLSALKHDPEQGEARTILSELYYLRYQEAERAQDTTQMIFFEEQFKQYASSEELKAFNLPIELDFSLFPSNVQLELYSVPLSKFPRSPKLLMSGAVPPSKTIEVERGSYLLKIAHPEGVEVRDHLVFSRGKKHQVKFSIPYRKSVPEGFVYVKDHIAMAQYPVTVEEYFEFLNDLPKDIGDRHAPRYLHTQYAKRNEEGVFTAPFKDTEGDEWLPKWPVILVSQEDAKHYAAWLGKKIGHHVRLPSADEWLLAAQGEDQRPYPWGLNFDPSLCTVRETHKRRPAPVEIGLSDHDCSIYGISDVAGTICQWSDTPVTETKGYFRVMGAAWNSMTLLCRLDQELRALANETFGHIGFRVMIELKDSDFIVSDHH